MTTDIKYQNGITLSQITQTLKSRKDVVKRSLESLAQKEPEFTLHLWKAQEVDSLGRLYDSYLLPYEEAMFFASTWGYKYAKDTYKYRPNLEANVAELLEENEKLIADLDKARKVNKMQADELDANMKAELNRVCMKATYVHKVNKLQNNVNQDSEVFEIVSREFPQTADRIFKLRKKNSDYNNAHYMDYTPHDAVTDGLQQAHEEYVEPCMEKLKEAGVTLELSYTTNVTKGLLLGNSSQTNI